MPTRRLADVTKGDVERRTVNCYLTVELTEVLEDLEGRTMAGMTISTSGVLLRAAERLEKTRDSKSTGFMLRELYRHLAILKNDPSLHARFFELYVDLDEPTRDTQPGPARD